MNFDQQTIYIVRLADQNYPDYWKREQEWAGKMPVWFMMEFLTFSAFLTTLFILLAKSRWIKIGVDSSNQFEPLYMTKIANKIIKVLQFHKKSKKKV